MFEKFCFVLGNSWKNSALYWSQLFSVVGLHGVNKYIFLAMIGWEREQLSYSCFSYFGFVFR